MSTDAPPDPLCLMYACSGSESIDLDEFHDFFGVKISAFSKNVFSALGTQAGNREIPFHDFMLNLWNYGTMDEQDIQKFIFELYDEDNGGTLDQAECESMVRMMYNVDKMDRDMQRRLKKADTNGDGELSFDEFCAFTKKEKRLLAPAFDLQRVIRQKAIYPAFWTKEGKRRKEMNFDSLISVFSNHNKNLVKAQESKKEAKQLEREAQGRREEEKRAAKQQKALLNKANKKQELLLWVAAHNRPIEKDYFDKFLQRTIIQHEIDLATKEKADVAVLAKLRTEAGRAKFRTCRHNGHVIFMRNQPPVRV